MAKKIVRVIFDTNVWVSFLIGKRLTFLKQYIVEGKITIILSKQLIDELTEVTGRERIRKYFPRESVDELIDFFGIIGK